MRKPFVFFFVFFFAYAKTKAKISCAVYVTVQLIVAFVFAKLGRKYHFSSSKDFCDCTDWFMSDLVRNDTDTAHIYDMTVQSCI